MHRNNRTRSGFTLAETLITMLLMSLVGLIVAGGLAMAVRVYHRIVLKSNAEVLLSTSISELRNELDRVEEVRAAYNAVPDDDSYTCELVEYRNSKETWHKIECEEAGGIYILDSNGYGSNTFSEKKPLVSEAVAPDGIYVTFDKIEFVGDDSMKPNVITTSKRSRFVIEGLCVHDKTGKILADTGDKQYTIRTMRAVNVVPYSKE